MDWAQKSRNPRCIEILSDSYDVKPAGTTRLIKRKSTQTTSRNYATNSAAASNNDLSQTDVPPSSDGKRRFEGLFSNLTQGGQNDNEAAAAAASTMDRAGVNNQQSSTPASKYKNLDTESNTSRIGDDQSPQLVASHKSNNGPSTWDDSDSQSSDTESDLAPKPVISSLLLYIINFYLKKK